MKLSDIVVDPAELEYIRYVCALFNAQSVTVVPTNESLVPKDSNGVRD